MNTLFKFAVVAALALAIGIGLGPLRPSGSNVAAGPSPSPSSSPVVLPSGGDLAPGDYTIEAGPWSPVGLTFTVSPGWTTSEGFVAKGGDLTAPGWDGEVMFSTWIVGDIYRNVCEQDMQLVSVGPSVDNLTNALHFQTGRTSSRIADVTVDGFPAKSIALTIPTDLDTAKCSEPGHVLLWPDPGAGMSGGLPGGPLGSTDTVYVVDVDGQRLVLVARNNPTASAQDVAELQALVDSIHIVAPTPSPSPS